jgi:hypothetical protein
MLRILDRDTHEKLLSKLDDKGRAGLFEKLAYLLTYADDGKAVPAETLVTIWPRIRDYGTWLDLEYSIVWAKRETLDFTPYMWGGLIYTESSNSWSVHT